MRIRSTSENESESKSESDMIPEMDLLLACARVTLSSTAEARVRRLCKQSIDWPLLLQAAEKHNLVPLLHMHLKRLCSADVPENILKSLNVHFVELSRRSLMLAKELNKLQRLFAGSPPTQSRIDCVPFKGALLIERYYEDLLLMGFSAIDFSVPEGDLVQAQKLLKQQGYSPLKWRDKTKFTDAQFESELFRRVCGAYTFVKEPEQIFVVLHWRLLPRLLFSDEVVQLQERDNDWTVDNQTVSSFPAEAQLLIHCAEASALAWSQLGLVTTVAEILDQPTLDWNLLLSLAKQFDCEKALMLGIHMTSYVGDANTREINEKKTFPIEPTSEICTVGAEIMRHLNRELISPSLATFDTMKYYLVLKNNWFERMTLLTRMHAEPSLDEFVLAQLPTVLFPAYYLLRPTNLLCQQLSSSVAKMFIDWRADQKLISIDNDVIGSR